MNRQTPDFEQDDLDMLLRSALRDRPEPLPGFDLARVARQRVIRANRQNWQPSRFERWNRILSLVASIAIILVATVVLHQRIQAGGFQSWFVSTDTTSTTSTVSATANTTDSSSAAADWMLVGIAIAVGATVVVVAQRMLASNEETGWWPQANL